MDPPLAIIPPIRFDRRLQDFCTRSAPAVSITYDVRRGKHLKANQKILQGQLVFSERAWVYSPSTRELFNARFDGSSCAFCGLGQKYFTGTAAACTHAKTSTKVGRSPEGEGNKMKPGARECMLKFCSLSCSKQSFSETGGILCPRANSAYTDLIEWCLKKECYTPHSIAVITLKLLKGRSEEAGTLQALTPGDELRSSTSQQLRDDLLLTSQRLVAAVIGSTPAAPDSEFLRNAHRFERNATDKGGLFPLHACMNHSCSPNVTFDLVPPVAPVDKKGTRFERHSAPPCVSTIYVVASRDIEEGEEITDSYRDTKNGVFRRRKELDDGYGFECQCERCLTDLQRFRTSARWVFLLVALFLVMIAARRIF
ncbi:SET domain-containing protein [Meredithblackwellia eburnea MCA 4105]